MQAAASFQEPEAYTMVSVTLWAVTQHFQSQTFGMADMIIMYTSPITCNVFHIQPKASTYKVSITWMVMSDFIQQVTVCQHANGTSQGLSIFGVLLHISFDFQFIPTFFDLDFESTLFLSPITGYRHDGSSWYRFSNFLHCAWCRHQRHYDQSGEVHATRQEPCSGLSAYVRMPCGRTPLVSQSYCLSSSCFALFVTCSFPGVVFVSPLRNVAITAFDQEKDKNTEHLTLERSSLQRNL